MRLQTKLVLATTAFITVLTALLCAVFLSELLHGRLAQAENANDVLAHEVLLSTRNALQGGLAAAPLKDASEANFEAAVAATLQSDEALSQTMNAIVLYSPTVQDVYVSGANGRVLVSSDATLFDKAPPERRSFAHLVESSVRTQWRSVFGKPEVFDIALTLQRNGKPFLFTHIGVRSSLLRNALAPWLRAAAMVALASLVCALVLAAVLSYFALRPIEQISRRLEQLSMRSGAGASEKAAGDTVERVTSTINRIDEQIRSSNEHSIELASNLSQMLRTLRDGILLLSPDGTIALASESVQNFLPTTRPVLAGSSVFDLFPQEQPLGRELNNALQRQATLLAYATELEDGRPVEVSLDFAEIAGPRADHLGAMLTLHDPTAQEEVEREIDLSRRLASIGRLTAGVGHEVKNPINAMVLHLELLRGKLPQPADGAARHLDVLASEMTRLDRVVQTLADFTRPLEPALREQPLRPVVESVLQLISVDAQQRKIQLYFDDLSKGARVLTDSEMLHQALLNIVLNAMDAMPDGGELSIRVARDRNFACVLIRDTGTGIPRETLEKIFHLYFTTKATGSGIGLAMTWRIVQMLGGNITVQSETDSSAERGTEFTVSLPLSHPGVSGTRGQEVQA